MPTHPENLKRGQWVVVVGVREPEAWIDFDERDRPRFNGRPLRVVLLEMPFLVVENSDGDRGSLDLRQHYVQVVSARYARAFHGVHGPAAKSGDKPDERDCPRCGSRTSQLLVVGKGWIQSCRACGYQGKKIA